MLALRRRMMKKKDNEPVEIDDEEQRIQMGKQLLKDIPDLYDKIEIRVIDTPEKLIEWLDDDEQW